MPTVRHDPTADAQDKRNALVLRILVAATFIVLLNETIMVNAIPVLMQVMDVQAQAAQWLSSGFMLTMAVVIPMTGWFLQRVGRRRSFAVAMTLFSAGTFIAALAPTFGVLLAGRVVQAGGTAIMMPLLMSTVLTLVPLEHRGRVMGNVSLAISVAPAIGPALSGVILGFASWRWLFGLVLPLAVVIGVVGWALLRAGESEHPGHPGRLDVPSLGLTVVGFGGLVYGLSVVGESAGRLGPALAYFAAGLAGTALFAWRQRRLVRRGLDPLLDLRVLDNRVYRTCIAIMAVAFGALMGAMIVLPLLLQQGRGVSTLQVGLLLMPGGLAMGLLGPLVGRLYDRVGARALMTPGAAVLVAGLATMAWAAGSAPTWVFLPTHVVVSVALAFVFTPIFAYGMSELAPHLYEHGSAFLGTMQQVAAAAGTALFVTVMTLRATALSEMGAGGAESLAGGVGLGLAVGAVLALFAFVLVLLLPRSASTPDRSRAIEEVPAGG